MSPKKSKLTLSLILLIFSTDIFEALAELFFKKAAIASGFTDLTLANWTLFVTKLPSLSWLWLGLLCYCLNFFLWLTVLYQVELSVAFPTGSVSYILVPAVAILFLHEHVSLWKWCGILLIVSGIWFISRSTDPEASHEP